MVRLEISMSPKHRAVDRAVKGARTHSDYVYNPETNGLLESLNVQQRAIHED